jgi:hypothetical protein
MFAFLKRRWILLSCAVVLLACSVFEMEWVPGEYPRPHSFFLEEGSFKYVYVPQADWFDGTRPPWRIRIRSPAFGSLPHYSRARFHTSDTRDSIWLFVPIWLLLAVVIGWISLFEVRWRAKMRKAAQDI